MSAVPRAIPLDDAWDEVLALLALHWPGLPEIVARARDYGTDWRALSRPFGVRVGGQLVAHAGVWALPTMVVDGKESRVAGIHAVCTRAELRKRGYARAALEAAIAHAETIASRQLLFAVEPRVYTSVGFRRTSPQRFELGLTRTLDGEATLRRLDLDDASERARLRALCRDRVRLSDRLCVVDGGALLILDELLGTRGHGGRLWWVDDKTIVAAELLEDELHIYDLVCTEPRPLAELARAWPGRFRRIVVYFDAAALELGAALEPYTEPGDRLRPRPVLGGDLPMLRGDASSAEAGFSLSPLATC